jgi:NADPH:quinone reductase-like Zn-dependent oxidoreductase
MRKEPSLMKAVVYRTHGSPDVLKYEDIEKPAAGDNEVLLKVRAASVNPLDYHLMHGGPFIFRVLFMRIKDIARPGVDVAGEVEAVGKKVTQFKPGDQVFGSCRGAFAEYACAPESALVLKPDNVTFEQAASVPVAAYTALQGLRDKAHVQPGQRVLINGAGGGVGTFAVQIAKSFGADVTGVCSSANVDMVRSIGADRVIDYTREDFAESRQRYDLFYDCVGNRSLSACRRVLNPKGMYLTIAGPHNGGVFGFLARLIGLLVSSPFVSQKQIMVAAKARKDDLTSMHELMKDGKVTPVIDRRYKLSEAAEAVRYLEQGHARGKVVITFD